MLEHQEGEEEEEEEEDSDLMNRLKAAMMADEGPTSSPSPPPSPPTPESPVVSDHTHTHTMLLYTGGNIGGFYINGLAFFGIIFNMKFAILSQNPPIAIFLENKSPTNASSRNGTCTCIHNYFIN